MMGEMKSGLVINPYKYRVTRRYNNGKSGYSVSDSKVLFHVERGIKGIPFCLFHKQVGIAPNFEASCGLLNIIDLEDRITRSCSWYPQPEKTTK